jgi:hypothetical protein
MSLDRSEDDVPSALEVVVAVVELKAVVVGLNATTAVLLVRVLRNAVTAMIFLKDDIDRLVVGWVIKFKSVVWIEDRGFSSVLLLMLMFDGV